MSLRLAVTYPATDGSMPESVELTWDDGSDPKSADLLAIVDRLLTAPSMRSHPLPVSKWEHPAGPHRTSAYTAGEHIPAGSPVAFSAMGQRVLHRYEEGVNTPAGIAGDALERDDRVESEFPSAHGTVWRKSTGDGS